ncbi:MAG: sensor domain-containing diguanylate cyclase [Gammaproteobacteria bacterium]|nr:sensor domain-containing diguanylate cyclase [Gammaproteobacteria bacterium]MDH3372659.1 sensor domain-containing diguanylate cyclase [Gammaproteobacteria bacterium]MDH3409500.1 sensor domain-containing diguanylate cyclase [Gammaproteobacteria bacterium]MDH3551006.1 sensor domain-containing diguanylate cyclase [Gammaproteobacteria bacterium]
MSADEDSIGLTDSLAGTATMRIAGLHKIDSFYTPLEERFERITRLGKNVLGVRAASVALIADDTLWFKSVVGWRVTELPLKNSLQQPMLDSGTPLIVPDTHNDLRYVKLPLVTGKPKFRFYAGYPLRDGDGEIIGSFCAYDTKPKKTDHKLDEILSDLGLLAERELLTTDLWNAQTQLVGKLDTARRQALLDPLTRVWNRRGGLELLDMVLQEAASSREQIAVCVVDVDHFKDINDQHGHGVGDQALTKIAASITASIRPEDVVSRHGGDEFLVILRDATPSICRMVGQRICSKIEATRVRTDNGGVGITVSVGIAVSESSDGVTAAQIIERADKALYQTKNRGRNGATVWPDDVS